MHRAALNLAVKEPTDADLIFWITIFIRVLQHPNWAERGLLERSVNCGDTVGFEAHLRYTK